MEFASPESSWAARVLQSRSAGLVFQPLGWRLRETDVEGEDGVTRDGGSYPEAH